MNYVKSLTLGICLVAMPFSQAGPVSWLWNKITGYPITSAVGTYFLYHNRATVKDKVVDPVVRKAKNYWENLKRGDRRTWIYSGAALIGAYLLYQYRGDGAQGVHIAARAPGDIAWAIDGAEQQRLNPGYDPLFVLGGILAGGYALYSQSNGLFADSDVAPVARSHNSKAPARFGNQNAQQNPVLVKQDRPQGIQVNNNNASVIGTALRQPVIAPLKAVPGIVQGAAQKTEPAVTVPVKEGPGVVQGPAQDTGAQKTEPAPVAEPKQEVVEIEPELCGLCTDEMITGDENVVRVGQNCTHFMHNTCRAMIITHARSKNTTALCPMCRTPFV